MNSVQRRIDEMADDVEPILCNILKMQPFGLQLAIYIARQQSITFFVSIIELR